MRTVITGGAGFVGSHLCERFLPNGHEVLCVDNLITGTPQHRAAAQHDRFPFIRHNISEPLQIDGPVDNVLHFASPASPADYLAAPDPDPQGRLARHAQRPRPGQGQGRAVPAGQHLRGLRRPRSPPPARGLLGQRQPDRPAACYDEAKRFAEAITMAYHRYHGVKTQIVRIFNTYGPRMRLNDGRVLPTSWARSSGASR